MKSAQKQGFTLVELLVVIGILGILAGALYPAINEGMASAQMTAVSARGRDIFNAITAANTEREPLGLGSVWPKTQLDSGSSGGGGSNPDISEMTFTSSSKFFYELNDGQNYGTQNWDPVAKGCDWSKLAGGGVKAKSSTGELQAENNMWVIAANVRDEMEDIIPILVTRNLDCTSLYKNLTDGNTSDKLTWSRTYAKPFGSKGFILIRKNGASEKIPSKYAIVKVVYKNQSFQTTVTGSTAPELTYLGPDSAQNPK